MCGVRVVADFHGQVDAGLVDVEAAGIAAASSADEENAADAALGPV